MPQPIGKTAPRDSSASNLVRTSSLGSCLTIHVEGRFDFNCHQQFRRAYEGAATPVTEYVVDLRGTEFTPLVAID
jgi:anti-anti-sigma regulatory factor